MSEDERRAREETLMDGLWDELLGAAYERYIDEGRGAVWIDMRTSPPGTPLYVTAENVLKRFSYPQLDQKLAEYQPRSEVLFVFGYPESVWVRLRYAVDPLSGHRLEARSIQDDHP